MYAYFKSHSQKGIGAIVIVIAIATLTLIVGGGWFAKEKGFSFQKIYSNILQNVGISRPQQRACTQEAKLCPDGSAVGRTGPNCEFALCPSEASCEGGECPARTAYQSKKECEAATGERCDYGMCDVIPAGKTVEEVCGKNFRKGWMPIGIRLEQGTWKTYRNEKYGFGVRYPGEWSVDPGDQIRFMRSGNAIVTVSFGNVEVMGVTYCGAYPQDARCEPLSNGIMVDWGSPSGFITKGSVAYMFSFTASSEKEKAIMRNFLLSFRFTK